MSTVLDKNGKPMQLVAATHTTPLADARAKPLRVCNCSNVVVEIAEYMITEMRRNPFSDEGRRITKANAYDPAKEMERWSALPWYARIGGPPDHGSIAASRKLEACTIWAERVAPGRPWDHKPPLREQLTHQNAFRAGWQRYGSEDYFYDIWSNIHYGYVGIACGFGIDELLGGAGLAQAAGDSFGNLMHLKAPRIQHHPENGSWANNFDDVPDNISIRLGADLYGKAKPAMLTVDILLKAITSVPIPWGNELAQAKRPHQCRQ